MQTRIRTILKSISKEYLFKKYVIENLTVREIGSLLGISYTFILLKLKEYNITYLDKKKFYFLNKKFGLLQPIKYYPRSELKSIGINHKECSYVKCICDCGNKIITKTNRLSRKDILPNCGCISKIIRKEKFWTGYKEISGSYVNSLKSRAKKANLVYKLSNKYLWALYLKQNKKCALSGIELIFQRNYQNINKKLQTASLDRIDSSKGYIKGNVQWVHKRINEMKKNDSDANFIDWCRLVANKNKTI